MRLKIAANLFINGVSQLNQQIEPQVALESTVIAHGLPHPLNLQTATGMEAIVRAEGAIPKTIGIVAGQVVAGLTENALALFADAAKSGNAATASTPVHKISRKDLPIAVARRWNGATTVATTMWIARQHGISVFATGGIGGVHRGNQADVSADLQELAQTSVIVVCAGAKAILDLPATLEYLETFGVSVIGMQTDRFPAFYSRSTSENLQVDAVCNAPEEVAEIWHAKQMLGLPGGLLVAVPIPEEDEIPAVEIEPVIEQAVAEARVKKLRSAQVTPFLLGRIAQLTGDRSLKANLSLLKNNARVAAQIAVALTAIKRS